MPFVYDDFGWLPDMRQTWTWTARDPWALVPFMAGASVSDGLPWGPHAVVLGLHLLNGFLLWALVRRWLSSTGALLTLLLFWLHPLPAQAVAYVTGGREVLLTTYVLIAALGAVSGRWLGAVVALASLGAAVTLKVSALPLLLVAPLLWAGWYGWGRVMAIALVVVGVSTTGIPWAADAEAVRTWATALWRYLAFVPAPYGFSVIHDWAAVPAARGAMFVGLTLALGVVAWRCRPRWSVPWWAWIWVVGLTGPRAFVQHAPSLTEAQTYLPFLAVWVLAGSAVDQTTAKGL